MIKLLYLPDPLYIIIVDIINELKYNYLECCLDFDRTFIQKSNTK